METSETNPGYRYLAADTIRDAFECARAGDKKAESWLLESEQILIFCAGLEINHDVLVNLYYDKNHRIKPLTSRGRPKKVTSG